MLPLQIGQPLQLQQQQQQATEIYERQRRAQLVRVGVLLCLLLALFDTNTNASRPPLHSSAEGHQDVLKSKPTAFTERVNSLLDEKRALTSNARDFPVNVTGLYRGSWLKTMTTSSVSANFSTSTTTTLPAAITAAFPLSSFSSPLTNGKILMQLKSVSIENIKQASYVYGMIRLSGAAGQKVGGDLLFPVQGVFLSTIGSLTMLVSPYSTQSLFLQVPKTADAVLTPLPAPTAPAQVPVAPLNANSSTDSNSNRKIRRLRRRLLSTSDVPVSISPSEKIWKNLVRILQHSLLNEDAISVLTIPDLLSSHSLSDTTSVNQRRRLMEEGGIGAHGIPLEFGMRLVLADAATIGEIRRNQTTHFIESVSSGLPLSFKNLQASVFHMAPASPGAACPIKAHFQADALVANLNDKDIPLLPGVSPSSNRLTPQAGSGESFSSVLNGGIATSSSNKNCGSVNGAVVGGGGIGFNISAISYHLQVNEVERKAATYAIVATTICFLQMGLLILQLRFAQTPALASRVSILGMCSQSLIDALICIGHLLLCAAIPGIFFQHLMWVAVLKLFIFVVFEMRAVVSIYHARYAQEISAQGWGALRRRLATLHFRFYAALFVSMLVIIGLRQRPAFLVVLLYSCWLPQIVFNAANGTRRALHPVYLFGMAASRLFIPLYVFGCPHNFLSLLLVEQSAFSYSPTACFLLVLWTAAQVSVLSAQDHFGPRFFIPKAWLPQRYDYYRPIPRHVFASSSPASSGSSTDSISDAELGEDTHECVICYEPVSLLHSRGEYMYTPCNHVFHRECLSRWLTQKLECPCCRTLLEEPEE